MSSYYDIDAILTDAQKVPCTFEITVPGLGHIDGHSGQDLKEGTKVELPLWLGEMLAVSQNVSSSSLVTLDLPQCLSARVLNALKADPRTLDIRALVPYFYALGARMLELFEDDELVDVLSDVRLSASSYPIGCFLVKCPITKLTVGQSLKKRSKEIADQAHNSRGALGEGADFLRGLDEEERQLFRAAHDSAKAVKSWMADLNQKI